MTVFSITYCRERLFRRSYQELGLVLLLDVWREAYLLYTDVKPGTERLMKQKHWHLPFWLLHFVGGKLRNLQTLVFNSKLVALLIKCECGVVLEKLRTPALVRIVRQTIFIMEPADVSRSVY